MKLLIVDDIAINRKLLRAILEAEGHTTLEATDGIEALQLLNSEKIHAVISDILMPRMDGYRLCHEIRTSERLRDMPIVIYTSNYTSASDEKLAHDLGADKYLKKPSPVATIVSAIHEAVAMQHTMPESDSLQQGEVLREYSDRLVAKLEDKNLELEMRLTLIELSMDVTTALIQGNTLRESLQGCTEAVVRHLGAAFARIWTLREGENVLELQASAGMYTHTDGPHCRVPVGQLEIGLIAAERKPRLTNSVAGDPLVPEQGWARREGLVAFAGYPMILEGRVVGVLALFSRCALSRAVFDQMASIADSVALGIGRKTVAEKLHLIHGELALLNASLERRVQERTSQLEAANKELETFAYSVSHDLRAPLRGIDGWSLAFLEDYGEQCDEQGRSYLNRVRSEARRLGKLVDDLLEYSRVTRLQIARCPVNLTALAEGIAKRLIGFETRRDIQFVIEPNMQAEGDETLLGVVLGNLFENAAKFSSGQSPAIIEFGQVVSEGKAEFYVRDNGVGFDMRHARNLFGVFQRLHKTSEFAGTGIGLATVARIIHRHGGSIRAESKIGEGAVFYFSVSS